MERKALLVLSLVVAMLSLSNLHVSAAPVEIDLQAGDIDPTDDQDNPHRSPILSPSVSIEDYTLSFDHSCLGCTLRLVDRSGDVVYATVINGDTLMLPSTLSGEYELQILFDDCYFFGFVGF